MNNSRFTIREITEIGVLSALAIVLDTFVKIPIGSTGGSINFSMVPLFIVALRHGPIKGFIASGIIYSIITAVIDAYGIAFFVFDYLIPFGLTAILGLVAKPIFNMYTSKEKLNVVFSFVVLALMIALQGLLRILSSSINSMLFYEVTYLEGIIYNVSYVLPSTAVNIVIMALMLPVIVMLSRRYKTSFLKNSFLGMIYDNTLIEDEIEEEEQII